LRDKARADALNLVKAWLAAGEYLRIFGLDRNNQRWRLDFFAQIATYATDRAAGADAGDEGVDPIKLLN
jgi:hypothetical protein